jgi:hypothetical protein
MVNVLCNSFIDIIGDSLLGAKATGIAKSGGPRECHVLDKSLCSVRAGIKKKFLDGGMEENKKIIREVCGFVLWEEFLAINQIAGKTMKMWVGETNRDLFYLGVLGFCHEDVFFVICWKRKE